MRTLPTILLQIFCEIIINLKVIALSIIDPDREIHNLDPQPLRYCLLASTPSAPQVTRWIEPGVVYWSRDLCSKHAALQRDWLAGGCHPI